MLLSSYRPIFHDLKKAFQRWTLQLGLVTYASILLMMVAYPIYGYLAFIFTFLIAFGAGCFQASAMRFFSGATLALSCGVVLSLFGLNAHERSDAHFFYLFIFTLTLVPGAIAFFAGYLTRKIAKAVSARQVVD
jgi:hypothetical protein